MDLTTHGVVALVRDGAGKYLLLEDARGATKGWWAPPHGGCEATDKSEEDGVVREVEEETGLQVKPLKKVHTQQADTRLKTVSFWLVELADNRPVVLNEESSRSGWFTLDETLRLPLYPGTKSFFEMIKRNELTYLN